MRGSRKAGDGRRGGWGGGTYDNACHNDQSFISCPLQRRHRTIYALLSLAWAAFQRDFIVLFRTTMYAIVAMLASCPMEFFSAPWRALSVAPQALSPWRSACDTPSVASTAPWAGAIVLLLVGEGACSLLEETQTKSNKIAVSIVPNKAHRPTDTRSWADPPCRP